MSVPKKGDEAVPMVVFGAIALTVAVIAALAALTRPEPWVALLGFWGLTLLLSGTALGLVYLGARRIAGAPVSRPTVSRDLAVVVALVVATVVSPKAMDSLIGAVAGVARGIVLETPFAVNLTEDIERRQAVASFCGQTPPTKVPAVTTGSKDDTPKVVTCPAELPTGSTLATAAVNDVIACAADPAFCVRHDPKWVAFETNPHLIQDWIAFAVTFLIALVISRSVIAARRDFLEAIRRRAAGETEAPAPAEHQKRTLMEYPTWVAVGVYAAILIPATYLAVGSLVYLRSTDAQAVDLAAWTQDLDRVEHTSLDPSQAFNAAAFSKATSNLDPATQAQLKPFVEAAQANEATFGKWKADYLSDALTGAKWEAQHAPAGVLASDKALLLAHYGHVLRQSRDMLRPCLDRLTAAQQAIEITNKAPADQSKPATAKTPLSADQRDGLAKDCQVVKLTASATTVIGEKADGAPDQDGPHALYGWLADSSDASVLIVGLVGFGLFGATIRMMGRVDVSPVSAEQLRSAKEAADSAAADVVKANEALTKARAAQAEASDRLQQATGRPAGDANALNELQRRVVEAQATVNDAKARDADKAAMSALLETLKPQIETLKRYLEQEQARSAAEAEAIAKRQAAQQALAEYDRLRTQSVSDRNSIVVRRIQPNGEVETVISGAPGKVFLQGLGAAFTSFLMAQASTKVLSDGGRVSAWSILLACFLGAVFAEEIWAKAQQSLRGAPAKASPGADGKAGGPNA